MQDPLPPPSNPDGTNSGLKTKLSVELGGSECVEMQKTTNRLSQAQPTTHHQHNHEAELADVCLMASVSNDITRDLCASHVSHRCTRFRACQSTPCFFSAGQGGLGQSAKSMHQASSLAPRKGRRQRFAAHPSRVACFQRHLLNAAHLRPLIH